MKKYYIVIAECAGEGVVFDNEDDANYALTGDPCCGASKSVLADEFRELYENDSNIYKVEIEI